jgi:hypothetical protein
MDEFTKIAENRRDVADPWVRFRRLKRLSSNSPTIQTYYPESYIENLAPFLKRGRLQRDLLNNHIIESQSLFGAYDDYIELMWHAVLALGLRRERFGGDAYSYDKLFIIGTEDSRFDSQIVSGVNQSLAPYKAQGRFLDIEAIVYHTHNV